MKCGVTRKIIFKTHQGALIRAGEIVCEDSNRRSTPIAFRAYKCDFCGGYHITGKHFQTRQQAYDE